MVCLLLVPLAVPGGAAAWAPPEAVYMPQTGHRLVGPFLTFWRDNGRAPAIGNPISEQLDEDGRTVQYFERARLELRGDTIVRGALGAEYLAARGIDLDARPRRPRLLRNDDFDEPATTPFTRLRAATFGGDPDEHRFFPESGHTLNFSFKLAWENTGGLARYGLPLSEELAERSPIDGAVYTTQYFERARLEYHPETASNYSIVVTPLGAAVAAARGVSTAATARGDTPEYAEALFAPPAPRAGVS